MLKLKNIKDWELVSVMIYKISGRNLYWMYKVPVEKVMDKLERKSDYGLVESAFRYADKKFQTGEKIRVLDYNRKKFGVEIVFESGHRIVG